MSNNKSNKPKIVCPECGKSFINLKSHQTKSHSNFTLKRIAPEHLQLFKNGELYMDFPECWGSCGFQSGHYYDYHSNSQERDDPDTDKETKKAILVKGIKSGIVEGICPSQTILVGKIEWI
jgi:ssDNA-binding Zn-finger/Zn-ribbon topoisomerase 1